MAEILLSICIPTYNRADRVVEKVNRIISGCDSDEIEVLVSDNASTDDTEEKLSRIKDPRFRYYRNKKNLGIGGNVLKVVERAIGDFIFIHWDDDCINLETIPWLIEKIKQNPSVNQIMGTVMKSDKVFWSCRKARCKEGEDEILAPGFDSLQRLLFTYSHGGARILRKKSINLDFAKEYINTALSPYMHQILEPHPVLTGSTLCTSKVLYYVESEQEDSVGHIYGGRVYWDSTNRFKQLKERIRIILAVTGKEKDRKLLLDRQREYAVSLIFYSFYKSIAVYRSPLRFFDILFKVISVDLLSLSPVFWFTFLNTTIYDFLRKTGFTRLFKIKCPRSAHVSLG